MILAFSLLPSQACNYPLELYEVSGAETWNEDSLLPGTCASLSPNIYLHFHTHVGRTHTRGQGCAC